MPGIERVWTAARHLAPLILMSLLALAAAPSDAGILESGEESTYGTFRGVEYRVYSGRFVGQTAQGPFRVPFAIVAPANPRRSNGAVVIEPPHFSLGTPGRDALLGSDLLFERRFSHASVGFAGFGLNILDPGAVDATIAGVSADMPVFPLMRDVEILGQFANALANDPFARQILGRLQRRYAFGVSQSAEALYELQYGGGAGGLFDLTVLHVPLWRPPFADPRTLAVLPDEFAPLPNIGKVMLIGAEGDLFASESRELRNAVQGPTANPNYRLYEVAGAPHLPLPRPLNPLDNAPVLRAMFVAGDRWARYGRTPPRSALLEEAPDGQPDPIHMGAVTGIARDLDGNALGGVALPDVALGRALFIASIPEPLPPPAPPGLVGLFGLWFDLACAPRPGSDSLAPRFKSHQSYVRGVWRQSLRLLARGYLLPKDAWAIVSEAIDSDVGKPGTCEAP